MKSELKLVLVAVVSTGCITTKSEGFVNYKAVGDVYGTKPQAVDYEEVGMMKASTSSFFWTSCDNVCKEAVLELKDQSKDRGGDSLIDVTYSYGSTQSKTPTCSTHWSWAYLYILPVFGPWVQKCNVEGVAVARVTAKTQNAQAIQNQANPGKQIEININNNQNNGAAPSSAAPAH